MNNILLICRDTPQNTLALTPAITILKRNFPKAKISVVSLYPWIFRNNPSVFKALPLGAAYSLFSVLREDSYDLAILTKPSLAYAAVLYAARIQKRLMPAAFYGNFLATQQIKTQGLPIKKAYLEMLKPLFVFMFPAKEQLYTSKQDDARAADILQQAGINKTDKFICIFPAAQKPHLNATKDFYAKLIDKLSDKRPEIKLLLTAENEKDLHTLNEIFWLSIKKPTIIRETFPPELLNAVISRSKGTISGCTLPSYLSVALGKKAIVFAPLKAEQFFPLPEGAALIKPKDNSCGANCLEDCQSLFLKDISLEHTIEVFDTIFAPDRKRGIFNEEGTFGFFDN